jgi:alkanesulfonate monooxygenase SsuD/methylene tetrahydromethanopterin reductase-like flavin-dependent oxidoreductase (luciferase family)
MTRSPLPVGKEPDGMVDVELSCGLPPGPDFADLAVLAEELGYARVWIFDSVPLWEDRSPTSRLPLSGRRGSGWPRRSTPRRNVRS